jgi:hypothetical protein
MPTAASRRFSSSRRLSRALAARRRLVIGAALAVAVAAAAGAAATNGFHFGHAPSSRARVSQYIKSVDLVQTQMNFEITKVAAAYRAYTGQSGSKGASTAQLTQAERTLHGLAHRVSTLSAPPDAAPLHRMLSTLLKAEYAVAVEVAGLARFTPAFHEVGVQAQVLSSELSKLLAAVPQPKAHLIRGTKKQIAEAQAAFAAASATAAAAQAKAVDAYDAALTVLLSRVKRISRPRVMEPAYAAEVAMLRQTRTAGAALAAALRSPKHANIAALSRRFALSARVAASVPRQRAEIAAIKAYDARVRRIGTLETDVQNELARLSNTLR